MKLRILDNSLRLRLSQKELEVLQDKRRVESRIEFTGSTLTYRISQKEGGEVSAEFSENLISVQIPKAVLEVFFHEEETGIKHEQIGSVKIKILIEKDFQCLAPRPGEDESNLFPNPNAKLHNN